MGKKVDDTIKLKTHWNATATATAAPRMVLGKISAIITQQIGPHENINPNRSLDYYAQTNFLFVICLSVFRLQWNPIAPSKRRDI